MVLIIAKELLILFFAHKCALLISSILCPGWRKRISTRKKLCLTAEKNDAEARKEQ